jgi:hypothetical protein
MFNILRDLHFTASSKERKELFIVVLYCNSLLTKHVTHNINIMHNILKGHNKIKSARSKEKHLVHK